MSEAWIKLEVDYCIHPKVQQAGNAAAGVFARSLAYCGMYLTDGFVPRSWLKNIASPREIKAVTDAGLWQEVTAGEWLCHLPNEAELVAMSDGFFIPDFLAQNRSKAEVKAIREAQREGGRKGANRRWKKEGDDD